MHGSLLVSDEDVPQPGPVHQGVIQRKDCTAGVSENGVDAQRKQRVDQDLRAAPERRWAATDLWARHGLAMRKGSECGDVLHSCILAGSAQKCLPKIDPKFISTGNPSAFADNPGMELDRFDIAILECLQRDARMSLNELSAQVGLTSSP